MSDEELLQVAFSHYDMSKWQELNDKTKDRHIQQSIATSLLVIARNSVEKTVNVADPTYSLDKDVDDII